MKRIVVAMTAIAAFASPAFAGVQSFSHTTATGTAPFTDNFSLPAFNTALGTLTSIELNLSTSSTAEVDIFNNTGTSQAFTNATSAVPVAVGGPAGVSTSQSLVAGPLAGTAPTGFNAYKGITGTASTSAFVPAANFAAYEAPPSNSNLAFVFNGQNGAYSGTAAPGVLFGGNASVGGTTQIIYTYTVATPPTPSVPEPAAFTILGLGIAGLSMVRRRHG